ncbi:MAG TPA: hypothetical protein VI306_11480 [Pyrinomonadaceae bacterium]
MKATRRFLPFFMDRKLALAFLILLTALPAAAQSNATTPGDGWVVLPVDEYRALRRAAYPAETDAAPPPVEATLTRIDYDLKVDNDIATGEARLTVDVIKNGWVTISIPTGLMVQEARLDGRPVTLVARPAEKGPGGADLLLSKAGRAVLSLKVVAPVLAVAGTEILQLPITNSAVSHATVELARQDVDVKITGGLLLTHADTANGSRWTANGQSSNLMTFAWSRRIDDQRVTQPLRMRGSLSQLIGLGEDSTQINAEVQIEVLQGVAQDVHLLLPDQFTVNQVSGAMVTDWDVNAKELIVSFIEPIQQTTRFTISGEARLPRSGKVDVPLLRLQAAERETGGVAVEVLGAGEIKERQTNGLDEAEAGELGQLIASRQSPSLVAFRLQPTDGKSSRSLSLNIARYTPQAVLTANIEEADYNALVTTDGKLLVQSRFAVRNNQRNFLKISLPSSAVLWSASVGGRPVRPGKAPDGSLLLPLEKMPTGENAAAFVVEVSYLDRTANWTDRGHLRLPLATVDLPISKSHLLLHHSPLFRLTASPGITTSFRIAPFEPAMADALRSNSNNVVRPSTSYNATTSNEPVSAFTQQLLSQSKRGTTSIRNLPLRVSFPHFGPSIFMISELTSENQIPVIELDFQRDKKRGDK